MSSPSPSAQLCTCSASLPAPASSSHRDSRVESCPYPLVLASLPSSSLPCCTGALLHLLLFDAHGPSRVFSYTHTDDEVSLLMDACAAVAAFPPGTLQLGPGEWRVLEIQEGAEIIDVPGIVDSLCRPLLQPPRVLDELLYLSTFSSDLLLVRESSVQAAQQMVSDNLTFLLESRRRVREQLDEADRMEAEAARRRQHMEAEDRARAIAASSAEEAAAEEDELRARAGIRVERPAIASQQQQQQLDSDLEVGGEEARVQTGSDLSPGSVSVGQGSLRVPEGGLPRRGSGASDLSGHIFHLSLHSSPHSDLGSESASVVEAPAAPPAPQPAFPRAHKLPEPAAYEEASAAATSDDDPDGGAGSVVGFEGEGVAMHLSRLPFRLVLLTFQVQHMPHCAHAIMRALIDHDEATTAGASASDAAARSIRPRFFSLTQAGDSVSLIVEASCLPYFPPAYVRQHHSVWSAIRVSQGSELMDAASLVAPLSSILAKHGYSIFYLSTANFDYVLVAEQQSDMAIQALRRAINVMVDH